MYYIEGHYLHYFDAGGYPHFRKGTWSDVPHLDKNEVYEAIESSNKSNYWKEVSNGIIINYLIPFEQWAIHSVPDIEVNGSDCPTRLSQSDTITATVSLNNNDITDNADWWLAAVTPFGLFFFTFDGWTDDWMPGHQGPLFYLDSFELFSMPVSGLPAGTYTLYFGVDTVMDGNVTWDSVYCDTVVVNITD